jgi:hypothetical protein
MSVLQERKFSEAKTGLSEVMDEVVREHRPQVVSRHQREHMLLVRSEDARRWLDTFRLDLGVTLDPGQVSIQAAPLGLIGVGESFDAALDQLAVEIRRYAVRFFDRIEFYRHTSAIRHEPYLLRFALAPVDEHRGLLEADIAAAAPQGSPVEAAASAV